MVYSEQLKSAGKSGGLTKQLSRVVELNVVMTCWRQRRKAVQTARAQGRDDAQRYTYQCESDSVVL